MIDRRRVERPAARGYQPPAPAHLGCLEVSGRVEMYVAAVCLISSLGLRRGGADPPGNWTRTRRQLSAHVTATTDIKSAKTRNVWTTDFPRWPGMRAVYLGKLSGSTWRTRLNGGLANVAVGASHRLVGVVVPEFDGGRNGIDRCCASGDLRSRLRAA